MRRRLYGNIARQAFLGRETLRTPARPSPGAAAAPRKRVAAAGPSERLPISTAVPIWGILSILGWLLAAHVTVGLLGPEERRQLAYPGGYAPAEAALADFTTAAGSVEP